MKLLRERKNLLYGCFSVHKEDKSKAICLTCKEKVSRGGSNPKNFNTTNLQKHLQSHRDKYKEFCKKEAAKRDRRNSEVSSSRQSTADKRTGKSKEYSRRISRRKKTIVLRAKELTYCLVVMIAIDLQPFSSDLKPHDFDTH